MANLNISVDASILSQHLTAIIAPGHNELVKHQIDSANRFYHDGLPNIITNFNIEKPKIVPGRTLNEEDKSIDYISCRVYPSNIILKKPCLDGNSNIPMFPNYAINKERSYSGKLYMDATIKAIAYLRNGGTIVREEKITDCEICSIPIIKGSDFCNTTMLTKDILLKLGEDPTDTGGYYIINGGCWGINSTESIGFNIPRIYKNVGHGKSLIRCELISKPGDSVQNSEYIITKLNNDKTLVLEIQRDQLNKIEIPFYLLYRAFGFSSDAEIINSIVLDETDPKNRDILNIVTDAMRATYQKKINYSSLTQIDALKMIVDLVGKPELFNKRDLSTPEKTVSNIFDLHVLPHIGIGIAFRYEKLKFISLIIRKLLYVHLGLALETDRDTHRIKRIHSGENYAKSFKALFNQLWVMAIKRRMQHDFIVFSFSSVQLSNIVRSISTDSLERAMLQAVTMGNKSQINIGTRSSVVNRLMSQSLVWKNAAFICSTLRGVNVSGESANQSDRANRMRRVHASAVGTICVSHSPPEGKSVGINKQFSIFARIAPPSSSYVLMQILADDADIINRNKVSMKEIFHNSYWSIYVNGHLIGYCQDGFALQTKYRNLRRSGKLNPYTSISLDTIEFELRFFVDIGRMTRPLFIVYNSHENPEMFSKKNIETKLDKSKKGGKEHLETKNSNLETKNGKEQPYKQFIAITADDINQVIAGEKTMEDLIEEQKIEFISPDEQENCFIAPNIDKLRENADNELINYTHCDVPESLFGITALTAPFANHNQAPRLTFQTSQCKQTCGYHALNWPLRYTDKETTLQEINEKPLITTLSNDYLFPNGMNVIVAIAVYQGFNQEDSLIIKKEAVERGLFGASKFTNVKTIFEQKEEKGTPDITKTTGIKSGNYSKLVNGVIPKGTFVSQDDIIIGKYMPIGNRDKSDPITYIDRSIVARNYGSNKVVVCHTTEDINENGRKFARVGLRIFHEVAIGDKFSSRAGQKGVCALLMSERDMPIGRNLSPTIIFNPHGMPSRMTVSQLLEMLVGKVCAIKGAHVDATAFRPIDIKSVEEELGKLGFSPNGYETLISGLTGEHMGAMVYIGPVFYQRLQKFASDSNYAVKTATTDPITMQPREGQVNSGGLKIGEMEHDCLVAQGPSLFLRKKFFDHSDRYTEYRCACGKPADVNLSQGIYRCSFCKDGADIFKFSTSYSAKLFRQQYTTAGIGANLIPTPFRIEHYDS